jgi:hypothetical protein
LLEYGESGLNNQKVACKFRKWHVFLKSGSNKVQSGLNRLIYSYKNRLRDQITPLRLGSIMIYADFSGLMLNYLDLC